MIRKLSIEQRLDPIANLREYEQTAHLDHAMRQSIILVVEEEFSSGAEAAAALDAIQQRGTVAVRIADLEACAGTDRAPLAHAPPPGRDGICSVCREVVAVDVAGRIAPHPPETEKPRRRRAPSPGRLLEID